jgi:hypothetical protein
MVSPHMIYADPSLRNGVEHGTFDVGLAEQSHSTFDRSHLFAKAQAVEIVAPCHFQSVSEDLAQAAMLPVVG